MSNNILRLNVKGLHCRSCELLVQNSLREIDGVTKVSVDYRKGIAIISYEGQKPSYDELKLGIQKSGYEMGQEDYRPLYDFNNDNLLELIIGLGVIFLFYIVLRNFGLTELSLDPKIVSSNYLLALLVGLVAGVSTCMALVGGLVLGLSSSFRVRHPESTKAENFRPHLFFAAGRILGYAIFGGLLGLLGTVFQLSSTMNAVLTILVAMLMLFMGLQLTGLFPRLSAQSFSLPTSISRYLGIHKNKHEYSHAYAAVLGSLTFFLPCGFTQAMQVVAISRGNFFEGSLIMGLFALGTAPGLLGIGGLSAAVKGSWKNLFFRIASLAILGLGLFNLNSGYTLLSSNWNFSKTGNSESSVIDEATDPNVNIEDGVQVVRMTETNRGYSPANFTIKKGVPVRWVIDGQAPYSCASALIVPKLGIEKNLQAGENIIEFTPTEAGKLSFSCSMGMYTGYFNVVDESVSKTANENSTTTVDAADGPVCSFKGCGNK